MSSKRFQKMLAEANKNPLVIMDEIERDSPVSINRENTRRVAVRVDEWQSLRTALERQAEELAQKDARIARLSQGAATRPS